MSSKPTVRDADLLTIRAMVNNIRENELYRKAEQAFHESLCIERQLQTSVHAFHSRIMITNINDNADKLTDMCTKVMNARKDVLHSPDDAFITQLYFHIQLMAAYRKLRAAAYGLLDNKPPERQKIKYESQIELAHKLQSDAYNAVCEIIDEHDIPIQVESKEDGHLSSTDHAPASAVVTPVDESENNDNESEWDEMNLMEQVD